MKKALAALGALSFLAAGIYGFINNGIIGLLLGLVGGLFPAIILIALSIIIDHQEIMLEEISELKRIAIESHNTTVGKTVCKKCGKNYSPDCTSCPFCGTR